MFSEKIIGTVLPKDLFEFVVSLWAYWDLQRSSPKVELAGIYVVNATSKCVSNDKAQPKNKASKNRM